MILYKMSLVNNIITSYKKNIKSSRQGIEDVIVSMTPQMVTLLVGLITSILLARGLGPEGMGEYALIISVSGFVAVASDLGINQTAIRFASRSASVDDKQSQYAVLRWAFRIRMLLVIIAVLVIFVLAPYICERVWNLKELASILRLSLLISIFTVISSIPIVYFQSLKRFRMNAIVSISQTSITLIGILVIAWLNKWSLELIIVTSIISAIAGAIIFINLVPKKAFISIEEIKKPLISKLKNFFEEPEVPKIKTVEDINPNNFLFYMIISTVIVAITTRVDVWLMGYYLTKNQIGVYAIAMYYTIPLAMILSAVNTAIWPRASSLKSYNQIISFLKKTFLLSLIIAVFGIFYSIIIPFSMPLIFGTVYSSGISVAQALCLGSCVAIIMCPVGVIGYSFGMIRHYWWMNIVQLIVAVTINIVLLPRIGIIASALAIIGYNIIGFMLIIILIYKKLKVQYV